MIRYKRSILLGKLANIDEALQRIREAVESEGRLRQVEVDDLAVLHLQRAIQAALDIANHLIASNGWETPNKSADAFATLARHEILEDAQVPIMRAMVGFRNLVVHRYADLDVGVVRNIVNNHLGDLSTFGAQVIESVGVRDDSEE